MVRRAKPEIEETESKTVLNLKPRECRWLTGGMTKKGLRIFCGATTRTAARPYCEEHHPLVYEKGEDNAFDDYN